MITYFLQEMSQNPLNGDREFRGALNPPAGRQPPPPPGNPTSSASFHAESLPPPPPQPVDFYQKHSDVSEKNYHPNVLNENYVKKESYNFVASPNLLQHQENLREENYNKYKQNFSRDFVNLRENNIQPFKREQFNQNYHRENFNITENPNMINNHDYNVHENYNLPENFNNMAKREHINFRNQFNNNYNGSRENEPLLHATPVAKVNLFVIYNPLRNLLWG